MRLQVLASCVQSSVAADFRRRMRTVDATELPHPASRITLMAEECERLLEVHGQEHQPALAPHLPNVVQVAAMQLYQLAGEELLPWLGTGGPGLPLGLVACGWALLTTLAPSGGPANAAP